MEGSPAPVKPLLVVEGLVKHFPVRSGLFGRAGAHVRAVDGLTFTVHEGETLGIVGEFGMRQIDRGAAADASDQAGPRRHRT